MPLPQKEENTVNYQQFFAGVVVYESRMGKIKGTVRRLQGSEGPWYSTIIQRTYVDREGVEGRAVTYGTNDLLVVAEVAKDCYLWVTTEINRQHDKEPHRGNSQTERVNEFGAGVRI